MQRQSLALAEESLRNNRARVAAGTMAPIDIVEAEAEVARNHEAVILAEAQLARAEDLLRTLILDPAAPDFWVVHLQPTDAPLIAARRLDVDEATRTAIERRTDIDQLRKQIEIGDLLVNDYPSWQVGLTIGYPLGRSTADAILARARLERPQTEARLREIEVRVASEVRDVARRVTPSPQRVEATAHHARARRTPAGGRAAPVRRRPVYELLPLPGAAGPRRAAQQGAPGDPRLPERLPGVFARRRLAVLQCHPSLTFLRRSVPAASGARRRH